MSVLNYLLLKKTTTAVASPSPPAGPAAFEQPPDKTGLLVTEELEKVLSESKLKVSRIATECRSKNRKFRDIEFDLENDRNLCLHGLSMSPENSFNPSDVRRVTEIFDNPQFFVDGARSSDIIQGALGDCWFVSALATMATKPNLIKSLCVARDEQVGVYGFVFFRDMRWVSVVIDDLLYTKIPKYEELSNNEKDIFHKDKDRYNDLARKGTKTLYFARSATEGETWVALFEKAYAKLHGDYAALQGGEACEAIEDMTGAVSSLIPCQDILDRDQFWKDELVNANQDRLFGCQFGQLNGSRNNNWGATINGLIANHSYSILQAKEIRGKRFLVIRNPWGESEWTGPWSDGSKEWTKEWLEILPELGHTFGNDGQFVMEYKDFLASWSNLDRTMLFDSTWVMSSQWLEVTLDTRFFKEISGLSMWSLDFILYKQGGTEPIAVANHHAKYWSRSVNLEVDLEQGEYVVHVRLDRLKIREDDYFEELSNTWDQRKLTRVLTERAISCSIASNFKLESELSSLPIPPNILAGQTLAELEAKAAALKLSLASHHLGTIQVPIMGPSTTTSKTVTTVVETITSSGSTDSLGTIIAPPLTPSEDPGPVISVTADMGGKSAGDEHSNNQVVAPLLEVLPTPPGVNDVKDPGDSGTVIVGLRVYTKQHAPTTISGQLRHVELGTSFAGLALVSANMKSK
ncbi:Calpain catalytic domain-containing protein [Mycena indigotica]|uniref:Calpain catalytic domain-containing protein n=1 Tax=Mycena indigotica TaxID=2126181 RepID=A0A8H6WEY0_9AGAR|nr:Calpain catalytic domain-containing protein [Mycena indigotica]KAF7312318.1 Calpain catalytic domain-containing protein [Mycena indigotica]